MSATFTEPLAAGYTVFVQPGCSSCLRTKELLARHGVPYRVVDVANDPAGLQHLVSRGIRQLPIVMRGEQWVCGQDIDDVARFTGLPVSGAARLPPAVLYDKWLAILDIAAAYVRLIPDARLAEPATPGRPGDAGSLAFHVFMIARAFIAAVDEGRADWAALSMQPPGASIAGGAAIARAGLAMKDELIAFRARRPVGASDTVATPDGPRSLHWLLERSTWHSAQHTRQLADILARLGIAAEPALAPALLAGLPLPERVWT